MIDVRRVLVICGGVGGERRSYNVASKCRSARHTQMEAVRTELAIAISGPIGHNDKPYSLLPARLF